MAYFELLQGLTKSDIFDLGYAGIGLKMTYANHGVGIAIGLAGGIYSFSNLQNQNHKIFVLLMLVFMFFVLILSQSRSSIVAGFAAIITSSVYYNLVLINSQSYLRKLRAHFIVLTFGAILFSALIAILSSQRWYSVELRLENFHSVINTIFNNPLGLGWGVWKDTMVQGNIHNMVLNYGVSIGVIGLISGILLILLGFVFFYINERMFLKPNKAVYCSFAIFFSGVIESSFAPQTPSEGINIGLILLACSTISHLNDKKRISS